MHDSRIRLKLAKGGRLRWVSHLDFQRAFGRAVRRSGLPLAYTQGFSPHPRCSMGPPLPLGLASRAEMADLHLAETIPADRFLARLQSALPPGMEALEAADLGPDDLKLSRSLLAFSYSVRRCPEEAVKAAAALRAAPSLPVTVEGKSGPVEKEARPSILAVLPAADGFDLVLSVTEGSVGVLHAVRALLNIGAEQALLLDICRTQAYSDPDIGRDLSLRRRGSAVPLLPSLPEDYSAWQLGASGEERADADRPRPRQNEG